MTARRFRIVGVSMLALLVSTGLRVCFREDGCADASGTWDRETRSCTAPWCTQEGGRWIEGPNYCIPRECVEQGLDWILG
jgi:hypothetical protein